LERGLIVDDLGRRQGILTLLNQVLGGDVQRQFASQQLNSQLELQERLNRLGTPEIGAQLNLQGQQANITRGIQAAQIRAQQENAQRQAMAALLAASF